MGRLIACPDCGSRFDVTRMQHGTKFRCGRCGTILRVPRPEGRTAPDAAPRSTVRRSGRSTSRSQPARARPTPRSKPVSRPVSRGRPPAPKAPPRPAPTPPEIPPAPEPVPVKPRKPRDPLFGETVGGVFRIKSKLGDGGYGTVYEAIDTILQRPVALKVMHTKFTNDPEFVGKFRREAKTAGKLAHRNIVRIHQVGQDRQLLGGILYLAMEFVDGRTLDDILRERGPLEAGEAIEILLQASNGLAAAHAEQIIHRDIKPGNLMITNRGVVKITDFGLAKETTDDSTSTIIGSPYYMPPEQFEGKARDGRSDIYSLGVTFYLMLTAHRPFTGNSPVDILRAIMTQEPVPVHEHVPGLPAELWPIVERMLARDLDSRYADIREVARDLRRLDEKQSGGKRTFCSQCAMPSQLTDTRCTECGASLKEPCPKCGAEDSIGVKFCGYCGCNISEEREFSEIHAEGRSLLEHGQPDRALEKFRRIADLRPLDEEIREEVANAEREVSALRKHRAAVQKAMAADDLDRAGELVEQARARFGGDGELNAAAEALTDMLRRRQVETSLAAAREKLREKRFEEALAAAEEASAAGAAPRDADPLREEARSALDRLAEIAAHARDLEAAASMSAAMAAWMKALAISPDWAPAREALEHHREQVERVAVARAEADAAFSRGDLASARILALQITEEIADDPGAAALIEKISRADTDVRRRLTGAMRRTAAGEIRAAFSEVEDIRDAYPAYPHLEKIRDHLEAILEAASSFRRLALDAENQGSTEQAGAFAEAAARLHASDRIVRESAARAERDQLSRTSAIRDARESLEASEFDKASEIIRPLADAHPGDHEVQDLCTQIRRGAEQRKRERRQILVARLNTAVRKARSALRDGDIDTARVSVDEALRIAPKHGEIRALSREIDEARERERKVEETAFFRLEDLRRMARENR